MIRMKVVRVFADERAKQRIMSNVSQTTANKWCGCKYVSSGTTTDGVAFQDHAIELNDGNTEQEADQTMTQLPLANRYKIVRSFADGRGKKRIMGNVSRATAEKWINCKLMSAGTGTDGVAWTDEMIALEPQTETNG